MGLAHALEQCMQQAALLALRGHIVAGSTSPPSCAAYAALPLLHDACSPRAKPARPPPQMAGAESLFELCCHCMRPMETRILDC